MAKTLIILVLLFDGTLIQERYELAREMSVYDCLLKGYDEADKKIKEIGREDINKHQIYIRFTCTQIDSV